MTRGERAGRTEAACSSAWCQITPAAPAPLPPARSKPACLAAYGPFGKYPIRGRNGRTVPDARPHVAVLCEIPGSGGWWADAAHHPEDQTVPGVTVLRVESGLFFGNADRDMIAAVGGHGQARRTIAP